jgi:protein-disulfide isomerase
MPAKNRTTTKNSKSTKTTKDIKNSKNTQKTTENIGAKRASVKTKNNSILGQVSSNKNIIIGAIVIIAIIAFIVGKLSFGSSAENNFSSEIESSGLDQNQRVRNVSDVEEVVAKWIEANPKAIIESVSNMQRKAVEEQRENAVKNISKKTKELFENKKDPQFAPKGYDVTIIEFFDYNCGYCKSANSTVKKLLAEDKKVRIIFKEFPILGPDSENITKYALAINAKYSNKYLDFHNALMSSKKRGNAAIEEALNKVNVKKSIIDAYIKANEKEIFAIIQANRELGSSIGINGTPGFVIGNDLIPGAVGLEALKAKIAEVRK